MLIGIECKRGLRVGESIEHHLFCVHWVHVICGGGDFDLFLIVSSVL